MSRTTIPPLKIQGIKSKAIPFIRESVDWNGRGRWIEPFLGSAVVPLNILPDLALLGDSNPNLIRFYKGIQEGMVTGESIRNFLELEGERLRQEGEGHYYRIRERFNSEGNPHDFLFLNRSCFNGLVRFNRKGGFNTPFCRKPDRFRPAYVTKICNQIEKAARIIAGRSWEFVCADWTGLVREAGKDDFVYCDPPYAGRFNDYFNSWSDEDAERLEKSLKALPCPFLYSMWSENRYRRNERMHKSFSAYEIRTFSHFYHLGASKNPRHAMTEALDIGRRTPPLHPSTPY